MVLHHDNTLIDFEHVAMTELTGHIITVWFSCGRRTTLYFKDDPRKASEVFLKIKDSK